MCKVTLDTVLKGLRLSDHYEIILRRIARGCSFAGLGGILANADCL